MKEYYQFFVDNPMSAFEGPLVVFGLARILAELLNYQTNGQGNVTITHQGAYYTIACDPVLDCRVVEKYSAQLMPIKPIKTANNASALPEDIEVIDYEVEQKRTDTFYTGLQDSITAPRGRI